MSTLIEHYLRGRGLRYFRGHHDDEFFFIVDMLADPGPGRMHVHLRPGEGGSVMVGITGDRFYPAAECENLRRLAQGWNASESLDIVVHDSCDPTLVGVRVDAAGVPAGPEGLATLVDAAVRSAAGFLGQAAGMCGSGHSARRSA